MAADRQTGVIVMAGVARPAGLYLHYHQLSVARVPGYYIEFPLTEPPVNGADD